MARGVGCVGGGCRECGSVRGGDELGCVAGHGNGEIFFFFSRSYGYFFLCFDLSKPLYTLSSVVVSVL